MTCVCEGGINHFLLPVIWMTQAWNDCDKEVEAVEQGFNLSPTLQVQGSWYEALVIKIFNFWLVHHSQPKNTEMSFFGEFENIPNYKSLSFAFSETEVEHGGILCWWGLNSQNRTISRVMPTLAATSMEYHWHQYASGFRHLLGCIRLALANYLHSHSCCQDRFIASLTEEKMQKEKISDLKIKSWFSTLFWVMSVILRILSQFQQITCVDASSKHVYQRKNFQIHKIGSGGIICKERITVPTDRIIGLKQTKVQSSWASCPSIKWKSWLSKFWMAWLNCSREKYAWGFN